MKVSVVMATYNGARYLDDQIRSIIGQTCPPDEIIVCDDRSTDKTVDLLEKYQEQGSLTYHVNDDQLGVISNFKKAASLAKPGNWVALSDQDDEWLSDKLRITAQLLAEINDESIPCIVYSDLILVDKDGVVLNRSFRSITGSDKYRHNLNSLIFVNFVTGCTVMMNSKALEYYLTMPANIRSHDEWLALIAFSFGKAVSTDVPTVRYRKHDANVSMPEAKINSRFTNIFKQALNALKGNDDFLLAQFEVVEKFYRHYYNEIPAEKKEIFEGFLKLNGRSYPVKKIAYRRMVNQNRL